MRSYPCRISPVGFLAAALPVLLLSALAVVRDPGALDSGKVPRLAVLNLILAAAVAASALTALRRRLDWSALRSPVVLAYAAYALSVWFSLTFAWNFSAGLLDASRTSSMLLVVGLLAVCFRSFAGWREWLAAAGTLAALVCTAIGTWEIATRFEGNFPSRADMEKVTGLMGNVNLYAGYLLLVWPWCVLGGAILKGWRRIPSLAAAVFLPAILLVLQSRSSWLGLMAAILVFASVLIVNPCAMGIPNRVRIGVLAGIVCAFLGLAGFVASASEENPVLRRAKDVFSEDIRISDGGRLMVWRGTMAMIADHFPFGVGAGNFPLRLHGSRAGGEIDFTRVEREWNQPHNDFLWIFAEKGVLGFVAFLAILAFGLRSGLRAVNRPTDPAEAWTATAALAGLAAYLVDSFFSFPLDRVNHQTALAVLFAVLAASRPMGSPPHSGAPIRTSRIEFKIWIGIASAILAAGLWVSFVSWNQERQVALARKAMERKNWTAMLLHSRKAWTPVRTLDSHMVPVSFLQGFALMKMGRTESAIERFRQALRENPDRHYILNNLAILFWERGDLEEAIALHQRTIALYPERPESRHNLALCLMEKGAHGEAVDVLRQIPESQRTARIQATLARAIRQKHASKQSATTPGAANP